MSHRDLTTDSIPKSILSLAVPMIASGTLHSVQSLVDMFYVGRLGPAALAAVGVSGAALMILITIFMGINISTSALVARAVGAKDSARASHVSAQSLMLTALLSCIIGMVGYMGSPSILRALGAESDVVRIGTGYLHVSFGGIYFASSAFVISGIFHGAGDAMTPLLLGVITTICNVIITPFLVFGWLGLPRMEVRGSALGTVIAQTIAFAAGILMLARGRSQVHLRVSDLRPDLATMWKVLAIGVPGALQMSARTLMDLALMTIVVKFGTLVTAAYTVGLRIRMIGLFPSFGFGTSAATMVGQNLGARRPERSRRSAWVAVQMALLVSGVVAVVSALLAPQLISLFNNAPAVIAAGSRLLRITALGLVGASVGIVFSRALSGAGDTISPLIITVVVLWGFQIPAAIYLSGIREMWGIPIPFTHLFAPIATNDETGVWYSIMAASVLQAIAAASWFSTGRWKNKKL